MQRDVETEDLVLADLRRRLAAAKAAGGRKAVIKVLSEAPNHTRTRFSGPVRLRDGVDYSIRLARIGGRFSFQEKFPWLVHLAAGNRKDYCFHNHMEFIGMTDEQCRWFTIEAEKRHVQFDGQYGYIVPGRRTYDRYAKADFEFAKRAGEVPRAKRSLGARLRRAGRSRKPVLRKSWSSLTIEEPLVVRSSRSSASIRAGWLGSGLRFSEYRAGLGLKPTLEVAVQRRRGTPAPQIVVDAIRKIYSRVVHERKENVDHSHEFIRQDKRVVPHALPERQIRELSQHYTRQECLDRLAAIESAGFKNSVGWYNWNKVYLKTFENG